MKLLTKAIEKQLRANSAKAGTDSTYNPKPVVKFFNPVGAATWLLTELDDDNRLFGLCDLGFQCPELGYVMLDELAELKLPFGLGIERDLHFKATKTISEYADEARHAGRITV